MQTSETECLAALREAAEKLEKSPTKAEYEELGLRPASGTIIRVIGSWNQAKERAGLKTNASRGSRVGSKPDDVELPEGTDWEELTVDQRWHYRNRSWNTERTRRRRSRLRGWVTEQKINAGCQNCGENDPDVLDFHHPEPAEKTMAVVDMVTYGYSRENLSEELSKCVVLCANCHRKEHGERYSGSGEETLRGWVHSYKQTSGCRRCDETDARSLVFHHVHGEKRRSVSQLVSNGCSKQEICDEMEKCELVCSNCHRKAHADQLEPND